MDEFTLFLRIIILEWLICILCAIIYYIYKKTKEISNENEFLEKISKYGIDITDKNKALEEIKQKYNKIDEILVKAYKDGYESVSCKNCEYSRNYRSCCEDKRKSNGNFMKKKVFNNFNDNEKQLYELYNEYYNHISIFSVIFTTLKYGLSANFITLFVFLMPYMPIIIY